MVPKSVYQMMNRDFLIQRELLTTALEATDNYLGVEKQAIAAGQASNPMMHDFSYHMSRAHDALQALGVLSDHTDYMKGHVQTMMKLHGHKDTAIEGLPFTHVPQADYDSDVTESVQEVTITEEADKGLAAKSKQSGISLNTLRTVYKRGVAAWRTGHRPGTNPQQWGMARVNSYIMKGKTYHTADKDLREEDELDDEDIEKMVNELQWEDLVDLYDDDELVGGEEDQEDNEEGEEEDDKEEVNEALSAQARIKKRQVFARLKSRRNVARKLKLRRASDMNTLQKRAKLAARRMLYRRFLRGRDKSQLSASEKTRIEQQVARLKTLQGTLAQRFMPKIRTIEQKRLAKARSKK